MIKYGTIGNQTGNLFMQRIVDGCIVAIVSLFVLAVYENAWTIEHTKEDMYAIFFDMFSFYYYIALMLLFFILPSFLDGFKDRKIFYRYTDEKQMPTKIYRLLRGILLIVCVVLFSVVFSDKYSRTEFYNDGIIIEYNKHNEIVNKYDKSDIDFIELRTDYIYNKSQIYYFAEAFIQVKDNSFIISEVEFITPDFDGVNYETERRLYGLRKIKENFPDKIKINAEHLDALLETEYYDYTKTQAKELCDIFEVDYDEMMLWLKEECDIVLEKDEE